MPRRALWKTEEGVEIEVWDLPVTLRRKADTALGPMDRLVRVRAKATEAPRRKREAWHFFEDVPYPAKERCFVETWLVVVRYEEPLFVLHVLSTVDKHRKETVVHEYQLPRDLVTPIAGARGLSYVELRHLLMCELVAAEELLRQRVVLNKDPTWSEIQPPRSWTQFTKHEGGEGLEQIVNVLSAAHEKIRRGVRWIPGPVSGVFGCIEPEDPRHLWDIDEQVLVTVRLICGMEWGESERRMVIQLPAVKVDYPRNTAHLFDQVWWALASGEREVREYVHGMWIVDAHTRTDTALQAPVPGVLMAASGQSLDATRTGLLEQLAWFWLLSPNLTAPGEED